MTNGVTEYEAYTVVIFFEKNHVACKYCPILETYARNQCRRTGEYILDIQNNVGWYCPLKKKGEEYGTEIQTATG